MAVADANVYYGASPLTVDFDASASFDPNGLPLTYSWNFGDNSPTSASINPSHEFVAPDDNPYSFILNDDYLSILSIPGAKEFALELNSLSKSHNMAGWRLGMLAGNADLVQNVLRFKSNMDSGMFRPIQKAAVAALQQPDSWYQSLNDIYHIRQQKAKQNHKIEQTKHV